MNSVKNVCLIPARGGSKRLPKKNIKLFHGKPLICWSIEAAKASKIFDEIFVSTDCPEIADIATQYGASVPFMRPKELANDFATDEQVRKHFIQWLSSNQINAKFLCYLYPTAPFITPSTLIGCFELLKKKKVASTLTITSYAYPVLRSLRLLDKDNQVEFVWKEYAQTRSQDLPELFHDAGQCYFFNLQDSFEDQTRSGFVLPRHLVQDIDTQEDFEFAERLFAALKIESMNHS